MKNSPENQTPDFISNLEQSLEKPLLTDETLAQNSYENVKVKPESENLLDATALKTSSILRGAMKILRKNSLTFLKVNTILTVGFLTILFLLLFFEVKLNKFFFSIPILRNIGVTNILPIIEIATFLIFFSWLRSSYLEIVNNYFRNEDGLKPMISGFKKIYKFTIIEVLQLASLLLGFRYFVALPSMSSKNKNATSAMMESREYASENPGAIILCSFFITILTLILIGSCVAISILMLQDRLTIILLNFLLFSFLFLPFHACYRFLLYKKFQQLSSAPKVEIEWGGRIWFAGSRLIFLGLVTVIIFLVVNGLFLDVFDKIITNFK
ncbi:MAG: hypothetical protein V4694_01020 [Pseudomonadota bacterium]